MKSCHVLIAVILCFVLADSSARATDAPRVLYLTASEPTGGESLGGPLLIREIVRQGILIAAREELGASTRDQALRESIPPDDKDCLKLNVDVHGPKPITAKIISSDGKVVWEGKLSDDDWMQDSIALTQNVAKLSRDTWPSALKSAALASNPPRRTGPTSRPADLDANLANLEIVSQFAALRELHRMLTTSNDPQTQGDLIRAYANLSQTIAFHWTAAPKVFAARALLYAQRMVDADPKSASALWHRAYARCFAGYPGAALEDINAALATNTNAPSWSYLLEAFCHYDTGQLVNMAANDPPSAPLASFLAYLTVAQCDAKGVIMNFGRAAGQLNPECVRLIDDMCAITGPGMLNSLVEIGPQTFSHSLGLHLEHLPAVPASLMKVITDSRKPGGNPRARIDVIETLDTAGAPGKDTAEPSWSVLGQLIQETTFVQIWRKADLIRFKWGVDASDFVRSQIAYIDEHPYKNFIRALGADPATQADQYTNLLQKIHVGDVPLAAAAMVNMMSRVGVKEPGSDKQIWHLAWTHCDATSFDLGGELHLYAGVPWDQREVTVARLQHVSPDSPIAIGNLICFDWDKQKSHAAEWEKTNGTHPQISRALGLKYIELQKWADAERCLRKWIAVAPDGDAYYSLAYMYEAQHQPEKAIETYKEFINKCEDLGLQHADAEVRIARYYMGKGELQEAIKYADAAAQTRAAWASECAVEAHERAGDYQYAESYISEVSQHYPDSGTLWYLWCARTGQGDRVSAKAVADQWIAQHQQASAGAYQAMIAQVYQVQGNLEEARATYRRSFDAEPNPSVALQIALMSDQMKDAKSRDEILKLAQDKAKNATIEGRKRVELIRLVNDFAKLYASPDAKLEPAEIYSLCDSCPSNECVNLYYFASWYYRLHGKDDLAKQMLKDAVKENNKNVFTTTLAWIDLRTMGVDPLSVLNSTTKP